MNEPTSTSRRYGAMAGVEVLRVQADDGVALAVHVLRRGQASAAPVVFVHALGMNGRMWDDVAAALPADAGLGDLLAIDCRGHGLSGDAPAPFETARFEQDIVAVLDALGAPAAHVVGCSMGGTVALAFARHHPDRLLSMAVIDATAWYGPDAPAAWEGRAQKALDGGMQALTEFQRARWFSPSFLDANPELVQGALDVFLANRVPSYVASCRMLGSADEREGLSAFTGPAHVLVGEDDYATPVAMSSDVVARLHDARFTVIPQARHYTPIEVPAVISQAVVELVGRAAR